MKKTYVKPYFEYIVLRTEESLACIASSPIIPVPVDSDPGKGKDKHKHK